MPRRDDLHKILVLGSGPGGRALAALACAWRQLVAHHTVLSAVVAPDGALEPGPAPALQVEHVPAGVADQRDGGKMLDDLRRKAVLVTGASGGIGRAIVLAHARAGRGDQRIRVQRTHEMRPPMPWFSLRDMKDEDLRALYQYIKTLVDLSESA